VAAATIADLQVMAAVDFDRTSCATLASRVEASILADGQLKRVKAVEMRKHDQLPLAAQEREAHASKAYRDAVANYAKAMAALEDIKAARAHARLTIDIWKALEASHRSIAL